MLKENFSLKSRKETDSERLHVDEAQKKTESHYYESLL